MSRMSHCSDTCIHSVVSPRTPVIAEDFLAHSLSCFPALMPWEVAVSTGVCSCDEEDSVTHSAYTNLYVSYLSRLLEEHGHQQQTLSEVFSNDPQLVLLSLQTVLGTAHLECHTHTAQSQPQ